MAGAWLLAQLAFAGWFAAQDLDLGLSAEGLLLVGAFLQLPASFPAILAVAMALGPWANERVELFLAWEWTLAACGNYLFWLVLLPPVLDQIDAKWPFERIYFGRRW